LSLKQWEGSERRVEMAELKGAMALIPTPITEKDEIDEDGLCKIIEYDLKKGCNAVGIFGAIGEGYLVSEIQRAKAIKIAVDHVKKRCPLIVGCPATGTLRAIELCQQAESLGADAILAFNPQGFRLYKDDELVEHYTMIAESVTIDVIPYSRLNDELSYDAIKRLVERKKVKYLKYGTHSCDMLRSIVNGLGDRLTILVGTDNFMLRHLLIGGKGILTATCAVFPEESIVLLNLVQERRINEARQYYQEKIIPWNDCAFYQNWQAVHKYALYLMGIIKSPKCLPPQSIIADYQIEEIRWLISKKFAD
jgi:dihydrodipicolinate synthase/N-acetylneuraminate lyase